MGDVLHGLPAVMGLRERFPEVRVGWAVEPRWRALLAGAVDRVHEVPVTGWKERPVSWATMRSIAGLRRELRAERYDVCVDLQGSIRSAVIARMSGAGRVVGAAHPRERQARAFYGERIGVAAEHVTGQACELLGGALGEEIGVETVQIGRVVAAEKWAERFGEGFVLLVPTAGWGAKVWPADRFAQVGERLRAAGYRVLVNWGEGDGGIRCTVAELVALVRRAALVIGGDTGPVHLAAALGRPVVSLFGPTDPARNGPGGFAGARATVLRDASSVTDHRRVEGTEAGLLRIGVDEVVAAAREALHG